MTETLLYNALGQMVKTSGGAEGTVLYAYDEAGHLLGEYTSSGGLIEETVWLGDIPIATLQPSGSTIAVYYVHTDELNTPRQVTRPSDNAQMWTWFSDPFGTTAANTNPAGAGAFIYNLRFPGQIYDSQAGLHQNYFRDYDPQVGRYVQSDPIGLRGGSYSPYAFVGENPISRFDRYGLWNWPSLPQSAVDVGEGFGEGVFSALTLGRLSLQELLQQANLPNGGANMCSASYRVANVAGFSTGLTASLGASTTQFVQAASVTSTAQATMLSMQLITGGADVATSFTEVSSMQDQLAAIAELAQEAANERGLLFPR